VTAGSREWIEFEARRPRHFDLESHARITIAIMRVASPQFNLACGAAVFDLNLIPIPPLLEGSHVNRRAVVSHDVNISRNVVDNNGSLSAKIVGFFKILG